jgi:AcrR family transcriptional regulator
VNAGSLYHYFKTKVSLIQAVFSRRLIPQDEERLRCLRICEEAAAPHPPTVEAILHALIGPLFKAAGDTPDGSQHYMKLMVQAYAETNAEVLDAIDRSVGSVIHVFAVALSRALPHLSAERIVWRIHFALSSVTTTMSGPALRRHPPAPDDVYNEIIPFLMAGLQAPAPVSGGPAKHGSKLGERQSLHTRQGLEKVPVEGGSPPVRGRTYT